MINQSVDLLSNHTPLNPASHSLIRHLRASHLPELSPLSAVGFGGCVDTAHNTVDPITFVLSFGIDSYIVVQKEVQ